MDVSGSGGKKEIPGKSVEAGAEYRAGVGANANAEGYETTICVCCPELKVPAWYRTRRAVRVVLVVAMILRRQPQPAASTPSRDWPGES